MSSTNKTTYYELSQYVGTDKPTYLGDYNADMLAIDTAIHGAAENASTAVSTANAASSAATAASTSASAAVTTANAANTTATEASNTAGTALTNAGAALTAAQNAELKAKANDITNLAPAYDSTLTYGVDDLVTHVDDNGTGKLYKCIVAIATPEAFNINKWDDVTTSEAYSTKSKTISTVTSDGSTTYESILNSMNIGEYTDGEYIFLEISPAGDISIYHSFYQKTRIELSLTYATSSKIDIIRVKIDSANSSYTIVSIANGGTITLSDQSSQTPASGTIFKLIKLNTL